VKTFIALVVGLCLFAIAAPEAQACWQPLYCSPFCTGKVTHITQVCAAQAVSDGYAVGSNYTTIYGRRCTSVDGNGAVGCTKGGIFVEFQPPSEPPNQPGNKCRLLSTATLSGIGCCQAPCPPTIPNCHEN
jgi:hypothetical protein